MGGNTVHLKLLKKKHLMFPYWFEGSFLILQVQDFLVRH